MFTVRAPRRLKRAMAMPFGSCGIVILAAGLTGRRDAQFLTRLTSFPDRFVLQVLRMMARLELWRSDRAFDLARTIRHDPSDFAGIDSSLHSLTEEFWNAWWSSDLGVALDTF